MTPARSGPPRSLAEAVRERAERDPDGELVRLVGGPAWTAAALHDRATTLARGLARVVRPGDAVVTSVDPGPETIALTTALSLIGAVEVALPDGTDPGWAERLSRDSGSVLAVADPSRLATEHALDPLERLSPLGVVRTRPTGSTWSEVTLDDLAAEPRPLPRHEPILATPALVVPTSGTTGRVKGALLPNGAAIGQARRVQRAMAYGVDDVVFSFFPWQHINARHAAFLPAALAGARVVIGRRFSASRFWEIAAVEGVTAFNFMGAVCAMLLRRPAGELDRAHAVTRAYGGPAPAWLVREMAARFDVQLRQAYACTELGDVATTGVRVRPGAAGVPVPEYELQVRDDAGTPVPDGDTGELVVRPRAPHLTFTGYVGNPEATRRAWQDGWFRTGDQVRLDHGWLFFEGRSADVIRRRGHNISAVAVEDAVATFDGVAEVAAVAVPSELTEDEVLVVVVPCGDSLDPEALHRHCRSVLPRHAVPRYVSVEPALPRSANLKVLRRDLRDRGLPASSWDAETRLTTSAQELG
ncbi:AMP-binding protein [Nocardioides sp. YIM 152315]|uniref:AMP-binding protein n=1 Tax=Nocardioides sp. YIM 152315 TaxID=3031760 RepID=UPI0023DC7F78|nr:AMP-binding protein [Nocardioides sp. YIM 152315]MDF1604501.1 AMP-binding protein [Nocardioides sp. YIM 152315]